MTVQQIRGTIAQIVKNEEGLYEGNLTYYFRIVFHQAQNLYNGYHNFRHMLHVTYLCYQACVFYAGQLSPRKMRNLLIAALFHDFNHSGLQGDDDLNIARAVRAMGKFLLLEDRPFEEEIAGMIKATQYPYVLDSEQLDLCSKIIRDADLGQALNPAWIQQVVFGLAKEWSLKPIDVLRTQGRFHRSVRFLTEWGRDTFPPDVVEAKIAEAEELVELLDEQPSAATA